MCVYLHHIQTFSLSLYRCLYVWNMIYSFVYTYFMCIIVFIYYFILIIILITILFIYAFIILLLFFIIIFFLYIYLNFFFSSWHFCHFYSRGNLRSFIFCVHAQYIFFFVLICCVWSLVLDFDWWQHLKHFIIMTTAFVRSSKPNFFCPTCTLE